MQLGSVIGHATSTIKHPSLGGWRLLIVQPTGADGQAQGDVLIAVSELGAGVGEQVLLNSDGKAARELMRDDKSPVRWFVIGIVDEAIKR